jgi:hypothetical protein
LRYARGSVKAGNFTSSSLRKCGRFAAGLRSIIGRYRSRFARLVGHETGTQGAPNGFLGTFRRFACGARQLLR